MNITLLIMQNVLFFILLFFFNKYFIQKSLVHLLHHAKRIIDMASHN